MKLSRITRAKSALLPGSGFDVQALLAPSQALALYFAHAAVRAPSSERVPLTQAVGRVLAQAVTADQNYPRVPRSAMDGFAVRAHETPGTLRVVGEVVMGAAWDGEMATKSAVRVPTGGCVPAQADAVVPIEDVELSDREIHVRSAVQAGNAVTPVASDMSKGEIILEPGRRIAGAELGVLATLGCVDVTVFSRPVIAVISSGDELVDVDRVPAPGQVRDSNRWAIAGTLEAMGATVTHMPIAADDPAHLKSLLHEALERADGVVLTGGSSVGEHDLTPAIVDDLGEPGVIVHGLRVKPGKPTVLASVGGKPVIGLPGNPTSALMILQAVAAPIVMALTGARKTFDAFDAVLSAPYRKRPGWTWFVPVRPDAGDCTRVIGLEMRSSMVSLLARAIGFMTLDEDVETVASGDRVRVTRFI